jgi:hypothetical protein
MANDDIDIFDPVMDTGKWRAMVLELLRREDADHKAQALAMEQLGKTIDLDRAESAKLVAELKAAYEARQGKPPSWVRTMWNAFWHGAGVAKAEGEKMFKE